ncbi:MAG TPA: MFS transporter [Chlamydiales bacterium]
MNASPWFIVANVLLATFMALSSATVTIVGNANIQGELALSSPKAQWIQIFYLLAVNSVVPAANWFAERFGYKRMYGLGVLVFALGSGAAALATNFWVLGIVRFIEGIGAGIIFPVGLAMIFRNVPKEKLSLALNLYIAVSFGGGLGLGMPLSGYFAQFLSWRWPLFLMLPLGLLAAVDCFFRHEETPRQEKGPFDLWGYLSFVTFIASLLVALSFGALPSTDEGWTSPFILGLFALAGAALIITVLIEKSHPFPLLPLQLFKDPIFVVSSAALFLLGMALFTSLSASSLFLIEALKYEKFVTGLICSMYGLAMAGASVLASQLIRKIPVPILLLGGLSILVVSYFLNNQITLQSGPGQVLMILFLRGLGVGLSLGPITGLAMHVVPKELGSEGATLLTFFRQVGVTYGGTVLGILTIKRAIFHAARFSEQTSTQIPGYRVVWRKMFGQFFSNLSDKGYLAARQAKFKIVENVETQAFIQGQNDALFVFGWVTLGVAVLMAGLIVHRVMRARKARSLPE